MTPGLLIAAPASGSGKTTVTLGLARAFSAAGLVVQCFKSGPDYIDPAFHLAATGRASYNLDSWAMTGTGIAQLIGGAQADGARPDLVIAEGSMGLHDGVARAGQCGNGASADVAVLAGWPVLLVIDASGQAQSAGAVALGMARFRPELTVAGVILNKIASPRHEALARAGVEAAGLRVLGALPRRPDITLPERHLGLVQAGEHDGLSERLDSMAALIAAHTDLDAVRDAAAVRMASSRGDCGGPAMPVLRPPGQRIALAQDQAFSFVYPHQIAGWRAAGAEILPFSPLADQAPDPTADCCWLPGGYPELHAGRLGEAEGFRNGLTRFAQTREVHGECGGYMALGAGLVAADGTRHRMAGLLGLETSFAKRRMHLGYRLAELAQPMPGFAAGARLCGHEFHYASILAQPDAPLAAVRDANGAAVAETGSARATARGGRVTGTFFHLIAEAA